VSIQEEMETQIAKDLNHTLKLVPESQRELFVFELSRYIANLIAIKETESRINKTKDDMAWQFINEADLSTYVLHQLDSIKDLEQQLLKLKAVK